MPSTRLHHVGREYPRVAPGYGAEVVRPGERSPRQSVFDAAVRAFNEGQMTPKPVMQQQQQIQSKKE
jgi:hypothetical protein